MVDDFNAETFVLMTVTYITLILIILRFALFLFQFMADREIDRAKMVVSSQKNFSIWKLINRGKSKELLRNCAF